MSSWSRSAPASWASSGSATRSCLSSTRSLIMLSTSMNGQTGPRRKITGFGTVMAPMSGFSELTGWADRPPGSPYGAYTDFISPRLHGDRPAGRAGSPAAHRRGAVPRHRPVRGVGPAARAGGCWTWEINGQLVSRDGDRNPAAAPHGIYRCADEDGRERWVGIAVEDDAQWAAFSHGRRVARPGRSSPASPPCTAARPARMTWMPHVSASTAGAAQHRGLLPAAARRARRARPRRPGPAAGPADPVPAVLPGAESHGDGQVAVRGQAGRAVR